MSGQYTSDPEASSLPNAGELYDVGLVIATSADLKSAFELTYKQTRQTHSTTVL